MSALLSVNGYTLDYATSQGTLRVLDDVTLDIAPGEVLGLVGESGSGKSTLAFAIMRDLPRNARERSGEIAFAGEELMRIDEAKLAKLRGRRISMVFQDPTASLNPTLTLGRQLAETLIRHQGLTRDAAWREGVEALRRVELSDPEAMMRRYPHEVSGGEKQRVVIATAFACRPELVIFDEPTTALDVITGARILDLFRRLRAETGVAGLYISHDLALVSRIADRVAVIRRGKIVETEPADKVFAAPREAYTRALVDAVPRPHRRLVADRPGERKLIDLNGVSVRYGRPRLFRRRETFGARAVSLDIRDGEILGIVGESGSGKSTLARAMTGLARFDGHIHFGERHIGGPADMDRRYRAAVQIVFQHPDASLNPRHRIGDILARPLALYGGQASEIPRLLEQVRLPAEYARRYPHQLSGGEKQRVAIARAFAAKPALVICDEVTASLDVSVQASVIELLLALRQAHGTAYAFITHDLNLVRQIAHRIAVMRRGVLVDLRDADKIEAQDADPYTRELIAACPVPVGERP
ncbi:peptide/nickel transport system ATP-binding protein [Rhizobiales bacterium GAS191]|jgi:peptide/nickel transport system ATP-binding protein|nr:peptide/nickel transport system ATP-binding protein [Rhizobiales bacterium GAS113]SED69497.1 peptide/nickel transport system ATP-binding protein [Rhizobiales bacterium GAS191]SEE72929.1 peptide/nickel transport system ATP-binding protein [Rhizobiales bacterium GAS188]